MQAVSKETPVVTCLTPLIVMSSTVALRREHALRLPLQQENSVVGQSQQLHLNVHAGLQSRLTRSIPAASSTAAKSVLPKAQRQQSLDPEVGQLSRPACHITD